jgi:hypothetical protein
MDDLGINKWLKDNYGTTVEGLPLFRLIWNDKTVTEHRFSEYHDYYGDILLRTVRETREVPKYPFCQDRWILERIHLIDERVRNLGLQTDKQYNYEEVYTFQDKQGKFLPLSQQKVEEALYLFFHYYLKMTPKERVDMRMAMLAKREEDKKQRTREIIGRVVDPAPHSLVLETFRPRKP